MPKVYKVVIICLVLGFLLLAYLQRRPIFKQTELMMDTVVEILSAGKDKSLCFKAMREAFKEMRRIEQLFNDYKKDSVISQINQRASQGWVKVPSEVFGLIKEAVYLAKISYGAFDITVRPLGELWRSFRGKRQPPSERLLEDTLKLVGYENIELDNKNLAIRFKKKGIRLDLGGIAKGYAVDKAIEVLKDNGIKNCLVNAGGDLFALGANPSKGYWEVGIRDPNKITDLIGTLRIKDMAVATSGIYERYLVIGKKHYSHIFNPKTGLPIRDVLSATVISSNTLQADALSTAVLVLSENKDLSFLKSFKSIKAIIIFSSNTSPTGIEIITYGDLEKIFFPKRGYFVRKIN